MTADRGLRRAYAHARRAGVSNAELANYNDQWADLLNNAEASPLGAAAGYWALAGELDRLATVAENDRDDDLPEL